MKEYYLERNGSGAGTDILAHDDQDAIERALLILRDDGYMVVADQWDDCGLNDEEEPVKRILIWWCEEDSRNDSGANSLAQLTTIGRA